MSTKTRVLNVRVVGFSAPERQMLNSIFLLSVAPARQIGYKLWNPEAGVAPDMYLLDGDSDSAVASWQATFASTSDRTLVVGAKNLDLGVASASRPLGLKVVGAMDRLAIALQNTALKNVQEATHDVSSPGAGASLPTSPAATSSTPKPDVTPRPDVTLKPEVPKQEQTLTRATAGMTSQQPVLSASMNAMAPMTAAAQSLSGHGLNSTLGASAAATHATTMSATQAAATHAASMPAAMTAAAPAATVLPSMTLQPNVALGDRTLNEKPVPEKTVDRILSDKPHADKPADKPADKLPEKTLNTPVVNLQASPVTPLSPSALSAAVAPSAARSNLRVVPNPVTAQPPASTPLAASLPAAARIADAPMPATSAPLTARIADAPMQAPAAPVQPVAPVVTVNVTPPAPVAPIAAPTARHEEHNFRVLAVDDSPLMRTFLQNKLAPYGISPEFAASGEEALFKISKQHFDLIFLDVMLPGMDGYDVCKMIKKNKDNNLMKVVMLTSKDKTFDRIRGTMAGCDGYLTKPVDELKLRAIIERHSVAQK
jgi:CheY-like chemotaxis protein